MYISQDHDTCTVHTCLEKRTCHLDLVMQVHTSAHLQAMPAWCVLGGRLPQGVLVWESHRTVFELGPPFRTQNGIKTLRVSCRQQPLAGFPFQNVNPEG